VMQLPLRFFIKSISRYDTAKLAAHGTVSKAAKSWFPRRLYFRFHRTKPNRERVGKPRRMLSLRLGRSSSVRSTLVNTVRRSYHDNVVDHYGKWISLLYYRQQGELSE
jgi:hypothetical protein